MWHETLFDELKASAYTGANRSVLWPSKYAKVRFPDPAGGAHDAPPNLLIVGERTLLPISHPTRRLRRLDYPDFGGRHSSPVWGALSPNTCSFFYRTSPGTTPPGCTTGMGCGRAPGSKRLRVSGKPSRNMACLCAFSITISLFCRKIRI